MAIISKKDLEAKINGIKTRTRNLRTDIQDVSIEIILHAYIHGDVTLADNLLTAMRALDRQTWVLWATQHGPFTLNKTSGKFGLNKEKRRIHATNTEEELREALALADNWWEATKSVKEIARALDVAARIQSVATSVTNAITEGKDIKIDAEAIRAAINNLKLALDAAGHSADVQKIEQYRRAA